MKATLAVTTNDGTVFDGTIELQPRRIAQRPGRRETEASPQLEPLTSLDFTLPIRPFMKQYGSSMSGPKKLALLVARLVEGKTGTPIPRSDVENNWNKMKALMGGTYNGAYDTRARDSGWIASPKRGEFELRPAWKEILE